MVFPQSRVTPRIKTHFEQFARKAREESSFAQTKVKLSALGSTA